MNMGVFEEKERDVREPMAFPQKKAAANKARSATTNPLLPNSKRPQRQA